jgi:hypothetical protein
MALQTRGRLGELGLNLSTSGYGLVVGSCEKENETSDSTKGGTFF